MNDLFKNSDITIYNKYYDAENDIEKYQRTVIKDVDWQEKRNANVSDKGLNLDNSILIFIDINSVGGKQYIGPKQFVRLSSEERVNYFTFSLGDKIVKGEIDFELTGIRPNSIADLQSNYDDVVTILGISSFSSHWEVEAK